MDADTLTELLSGRHLNMEERIARGAWPHPPLRYAELVDHIGSLLDTHGHFPRAYAAHVPGEAADERVTLERWGPHRYVAHVRRGLALDPYTIAEEATHEFPNTRAAADFYLRWELGLPGSLDGWDVVA